jgi:hypothetical protein
VALVQTNGALATLFPKHPDAVEVKDFQPINRIHSIAKMISKVMVGAVDTNVGRITQEHLNLCKVTAQQLSSGAGHHQEAA